MKSKLYYRGLTLNYTKTDRKALTKVNNQLHDLVKIRRTLKMLDKLNILHKENRERLISIKNRAGEGLNLIRQELRAENSTSYKLAYERKPLFYREKIEKDDPNDPDTYYIEYKYQSANPILDIKISNGINHINAIKEGARQIEEMIRDVRSQMKTPEMDDDVITYANTTFNVRKCGGVHLDPNSWLDVFQTKNYQKCFEKKVPKDNNSHLGVEIEFYCKVDRDTLARELTKEKLQNNVNITTDASLKNMPEDCTHAHELRICAEEKDMESVITRVCKVLNSEKVGGKVNKTCGLHVHLDMRQIKKNKELIFHNLVNSQGLLFALVPKSRRENKFCAFVKSNNYSESNGHHHDAISGRDAYSKHKTFEVRIHSGTLNANKINSWIQLLLLITYNTNTMPPVQGLTEFMKSLSNPLTPELKSYIEKRVDELEKRTEEVNGEE